MLMMCLQVYDANTVSICLWGLHITNNDTPLRTPEVDYSYTEWLHRSILTTFFLGKTRTQNFQREGRFLLEREVLYSFAGQVACRYCKR